MKKSRIAVIVLLLLTAGTVFAQEANTAVTNLAWVDAEGNALTEAHLYDTLYAAADINGAHIPDGAEVSVIIFEYNEDDGLPDDYVTQLSATVRDGAIRAAWKVAYDEEQTNTQCARDITEKGWTIPRYRFRVRYGAAGSPGGAGDGETYRSAFSAPLTAWSFVFLQMLDDVTKAGMPRKPCILFLPDGTKRKVVADDEGYIRVLRLPTGPCYILSDPDYLYFFDEGNPADSYSIKREPEVDDDKDVEVEVVDDDDTADTGADFDAETFLELCRSGTAEEIRAAIDAGADVNMRVREDWTPLIWAAANNRLTAAQLLLDVGADVNAADDHGWTPLMWAAGTDHEDMVQLLLDAGADIAVRNKDGKTALDIASADDMYDTKTWSLLAEAAGMSVDAVDAEAFYELCKSGTAAEVRAAIDAGADVNGRAKDGGTPLTIAVLWHKDADMVRVLIDAGADVNVADNVGDTPLLTAAHSRETAAAQLLLDAGADVNAANKWGRTPLMWAASSDNADMVRLLLGAGADITARTEDGNTAPARAHLGTTAYAILRAAARAAGMSVDAIDAEAFFELCKSGTAKEVRAAIDAGADVNTHDRHGRTPLIFAATFNDADTVRIILDAGADVNSVDDGGIGPLMAAAAKNKSAVARLLLDAGADVNAADDDGWTPLMFAASAEVFAEITDNEDMVRLLLDAGADITTRNEDGNTALYLARKWGGESSPAYDILRAAAEAAGMRIRE
ncbi:hypothetical protein FACS189491_04820 [Spirochaetia bacterium]|nr:hypothetical protein FACS189491_04820 [Spirochaetia bacterium]